MSITVNLYSTKEGELKIFLEKYYEKSIEMDDDVSQWVYVYNDPLNAADIISAVIDNKEKFAISIFLQLINGDIQQVTKENYNDIIKGLFCLFYKDTADVQNSVLT